MNLSFLRRRMPPTLRRALGAEEHIAASVPTHGGPTLAASRFGLWLVSDGSVERIDWDLVSKARLVDGELQITVAARVTTWPDGTVILQDRAPLAFRPVRSSKLTDVVHQRVRSSVVASAHVTWPGAGGWVVLRRIAGNDGLTVQVRLDADADPAAQGFDEAVSDIAAQMWPASVAQPGC